MSSSQAVGPAQLAAIAKKTSTRNSVRFRRHAEKRPPLHAQHTYRRQRFKIVVNNNGTRIHGRVHAATALNLRGQVARTRDGGAEGVERDWARVALEEGDDARAKGGEARVARDKHIVRGAARAVRDALTPAVFAGLVGSQGARGRSGATYIGAGCVRRRRPRVVARRVVAAAMQRTAAAAAAATEMAARARACASARSMRGDRALRMGCGAVRSGVRAGRRACIAAF